MLDSWDVLIMMLLQMLKEVLVGGWDLGVREIMQYRNQGSIKKVVCWNCGKRLKSKEEHSRKCCKLCKANQDRPAQICFTQDILC